MRVKTSGQGLNGPGSAVPWLKKTLRDLGAAAPPVRVELPATPALPVCQAFSSFAVHFD
jgi:hypothetical protein